MVCPYTLTPPGGVQEHILALARIFKKRGHKVKIIAPDYPPNLRPSKIPPDIIFIGRGRKVNLNGTASWITLGLNYEPRVQKVLERERFEVLHFHQPTTPTFSWFVWANSQVANVVTFHRAGNLSNEERALYLIFSPLIFTLTHRLQAKIAVSESARKNSSQFFPGNYEIIPNGIDLERFKPQGSKIEKFHPKNEEKLNILFVGRIEERKGLIYLLKAFRGLQEKNLPCRLIIVGEGTQKETLEEFVFKQKIPEVYFEGHVSSQKLPSYYRTADIFCSPATHGESFGIVLLEAMASGLPITTCANPGYREVLKNYPFPLVPPKNISVLVLALEQMIKDQGLRRKLRLFGLAKVKNYSWEKIADQVLEVYKKAIIVKKHNSILPLPEEFGIKDQVSQIFTQIRRFTNLLE